MSSRGLGIISATILGLAWIESAGAIKEGYDLHKALPNLKQDDAKVVYAAGEANRCTTLSDSLQSSCNIYRAVRHLQ